MGDVTDEAGGTIAGDGGRGDRVHEGRMLGLGGGKFMGGTGDVVAGGVGVSGKGGVGVSSATSAEFVGGRQVTGISRLMGVRSVRCLNSVMPTLRTASPILQ